MGTFTLKGYDVIERADHFELWCKRCNRGWKLERLRGGEGPAANNLMHLVNHQRKHEKVAGQG
jgi:hypothetical protein